MKSEKRLDRKNTEYVIPFIWNSKLIYDVRCWDKSSFA